MRGEIVFENYVHYNATVTFYQKLPKKLNVTVTFFQELSYMLSPYLAETPIPSLN